MRSRCTYNTPCCSPSPAATANPSPSRVSSDPPPPPHPSSPCAAPPPPPLIPRSTSSSRGRCPASTPAERSSWRPAARHDSPRLLPCSHNPVSTPFHRLLPPPPPPQNAHRSDADLCDFPISDRQAATSPNGNGGLYTALADSGCLAHMKQNGIQVSPVVEGVGEEQMSRRERGRWIPREQSLWFQVLVELSRGS